MAISISGTVYTDEGTTPMGSGRTVAVSVNGAAAAGTTTTASDGTYTIAAITAAAGAVLTVYLQGNAELGVCVTKSTNANMTGVDVYQNGLSVRSDNSALSATNLNTSDNNGASGITGVYSCASTSAATLQGGMSLYVQSGQTMGFITTSFTVPGSFSNRGTLSSPGSLIMTGSGTVRCNGGSAGGLTINAGGTYTLADAASATVVTLTAGTLDVSASNFGVTCLSNWSATAGVFVCRQGTVTLNGPNSIGRTLSGAAGAFYHLTLQGTARTVTVTADLTVSGNLTLSTGTLDLGGKNLTLAGNFANSATFTHSNGAVVLNGSGQTITGSSTFYDLTKTVSAADTLTFTDGTTQTVSHSLTLQGAAGQLLTLAGTSTGGWTVAVPATQTLDHLSVSYSTATGNTAAAGAGSVDGGNNAGWTFPAAGGAGRELTMGAG